MNDFIYDGSSYAYCRIKYPYSYFQQCKKDDFNVKGFWNLGKTQL